MKVIDPHIHLWDLDSHYYPWLAKSSQSFVGDSAELKHNYLPRDLLAEAGDIEVMKVVHIDANHDPANPLEETRWLQSLADDPAQRGLPHGIVAAADLSRDDAEALLAAHAAFRNTRGIRQILNVHADPLYDYVGRHYMREAGWRRNFPLLAKYGLSFDLQLYPLQMPDAVALARANPEVQLIVNHTGMFVDRDHPSGYRAWRDGMRLLAGCPNVAVKISGLAMFDHHWTIESFRPYVLETLDTFGVERCMFASNFPVDRLFARYTDLWHAFAAIVAGLDRVEKDAVFFANAQRIYRL